MKTKRVLSIAGIAAPIIFFVLVITLGALEPGYSHLSNMMSVLGGVQGIRGFLFNDSDHRSTSYSICGWSTAFLKRRWQIEGRNDSSDIWRDRSGTIGRVCVQ